MALFFGTTTPIETQLRDIRTRLSLVDQTALNNQEALATIIRVLGGIVTSQERFNENIGQIDADLDVIREGVQGLRQHAANLESVLADLEANQVDVTALRPVVEEARQIADGFRAIATPGEDNPTVDDVHVDPAEGVDPVEPLPEAPADDTATEAPAEEAPATGDTGAADDTADTPVGDDTTSPEDVAPAPADTGTVGEVAPDAVPAEGATDGTDEGTSQA